MPPPLPRTSPAPSSPPSTSIGSTFENSESSCITHDSVVVLPSDSGHATGSSHVKMKTIVDYAWEHKFYDGHIAACHGEYLAYAIKGQCRAERLPC